MAETQDDTLGTVDGISYDENVTINATGNLSDAELEEYVARTMARIELIRGLEFERTPSVEIIDREEVQDRFDPETNETATLADRLWHATFIIGQNSSAEAVIHDMATDSILGYYSPWNESVTLVKDDGQVDKWVLVHELVHVLQDQNLELQNWFPTHDEDLGASGAIEGEAEYVPSLYFARCGVQWSCQDTGDRPVGSERVNLGLQLATLNPYEVGDDFIEHVRLREGWEGVNRIYDNYPVSTEQVIYPERYPDVDPTPVSIDDRSTAAWERLGRDGAETVGQATIFSMLAHHDVITPDWPVDYRHEFTDGWRGDTLIGYEGPDSEPGFVWETRWDSTDDAAQFRHAYEAVLEGHDAIDRDTDIYDIPNGPFAGVYRLTQEDRTVRIVHGPTVPALEAIYPTATE